MRQLYELRSTKVRKASPTFSNTRVATTISLVPMDVGISGTKEKRPELDRLMVDAHRRRFDAVVVWKFDRFARSVSHLLRALETFRAQGIEFVSFSEQFDTSTPAGKMAFSVLGAVAELERGLIVERVKAGLRNARAKGRQGAPIRSWTRNELPRSGLRESVGSELPRIWGLEAELSTALPRTAPKFGKGFFEP